MGFHQITPVADRPSGRVHFLPIHSKDTAADRAKALYSHILRHHGLPDAIISDRDHRFTLTFWKDFFLCGGKFKMSSARHPQTEGASVVMNRTVGNFIRCYCYVKQDNRDLLVTATEFAYNSTLSEVLGASTFEINLGGNLETH